MRQIIHVQAALAGIVSLVLLLLSDPAIAAGTTEINYTKDGKLTAAACLDHLTGKPPTTAISQSGFRTKSKTKRGTIYQKTKTGGFLPTYFVFGTYQKGNDPSKLKCSWVLGMVGHLMVETLAPDFRDFLTALTKEFKSKGYKLTTAKNKFGKEQLYWTGPNGTFKSSITTQSPVVFVEITPN